MYPPQFNYERVDSVAEAISLLVNRDGAMILAGGHSLIPILKLRQASPSVLVDIGRIPSLKGVQTSNGSFQIGALASHAEIAASTKLPAGLAEAAGMVADLQVRNRGTIGGNVAHADPASDLPAVLTALGASFRATGAGGDRSIEADSFFIDLLSTALAPDEVLTAVVLPRPAAGTGTAYAKLQNPASNYAIVGAAAQVIAEGRHCLGASVVVGGVRPIPTRLASVEQSLIGEELNAANLEAAAKLAEDDLADDLLSDIHASASYRKAMSRVFVREALKKAAERALA